MNSVVLVGRISKAPEMTATRNDTRFCKLSLATTEGKDRKAVWHTVTVFGDMAENCCKFLVKGQEVAIQGRINYSTSEKDGVVKYFTDIIANNVEFLSKPKDYVAEVKDAETVAPQGSNDDTPF